MSYHFHWKCELFKCLSCFCVTQDIECFLAFARVTDWGTGRQQQCAESVGVTAVLYVHRLSGRAGLTEPWPCVCLCDSAESAALHAHSPYHHQPPPPPPPAGAVQPIGFHGLHISISPLPAGPLMAPILSRPPLSPAHMDEHYLYLMSQLESARHGGAQRGATRTQIERNTLPHRYKVGRAH